MALSIEVDRERIVQFCAKWKVDELSLFGSVLHSGFRPESDVDVLVRFSTEEHWDLLDWVDMTEELKGIFGRPVDLVEEDGLRNPFRRHAILAAREVVYAV